MAISLSRIAFLEVLESIEKHLPEEIDFSNAMVRQDRAIIYGDVYEDGLNSLEDDSGWAAVALHSYMRAIAGLREKLLVIQPKNINHSYLIEIAEGIISEPEWSHLIFESS